MIVLLSQAYDRTLQKFEIPLPINLPVRNRNAACSPTNVPRSVISHLLPLLALPRTHHTSLRILQNIL